MTGDGTNLAIQTIQDPWAYLCVFVLGILGFGVRALIKGDLRTSREVDASTERAKDAEAALRVRDAQVDAALRVLPQVAEVLEKFHLAGEQVRQERATEGDTS